MVLDARDNPHHIRQDQLSTARRAAHRPYSNPTCPPSADALFELYNLGHDIMR
jgi:hypothetical protein